jgi:hypothetical protein
MHLEIITKKLLFNIKLRYNFSMIVYVIWLIGVLAWNFGVPDAKPLEDVIIAILLSFLSIGLKKYLKL